MGKLAAMDRLANKEAKKLGIEIRLNVVWHTQCPTTHRWYHYRFAHAHCYPDTKDYGTICIRWGHKDWKNTIKHEVAHFVPSGHDHNGVGFLKARSQQGSVAASRELIRRGKKRCPRHRWMRGRTIEEKVTSKGLLVLYESRCANCEKSVGEG